MAKHKCYKEVELAEMNIKLTDVRDKVNEIHDSLLPEWHETKGAINTWKWVAGSGLVLSLLKFIIK